MAGKLILCPTPIGNLEDMSFRMVRALSHTDLIAAEDTRNTLKLLNAFSIKKIPLTSYHEHNKKEKGPYLLDKLREGLTITLVTDAGTPGISDPGSDLARQAMEEGIKVVSIPGPCACITALTISGLPTKRFAFDGFLPRAKKPRKEMMESYKMEQRTIILYEAPHRLISTLQELHDALGDRLISICKELTKYHETVFSFTLSTAIEYFEENPPKGEYVVLLKGISDEELASEMKKRWDAISLMEHLGIYQSQGMTKKDAMKQVAKDRGLSKRDIYEALLE